MNGNQFLSLGFAAALMSIAAGVQAQTTVNVAGNWNVTASGEILANGMVRLAQTGPNVSGTFGRSGRIDGKFQPNTPQLDANWSDASGTGWMTIVFSADGSRFSGEWGRPGSRPSGSFSALRWAYPVVTGQYVVDVSGGNALSSRRVVLRQLGQDVVGNFGPGTEIDGTMAAENNTLTGTWKGPNGSGWMTLRFADDSKSFQGDWGQASGAEAEGHITGNVVNHAQLWVKGLWNVASSGEAFSGGVLTMSQREQTVTGTYAGGRIAGVLPRGSYVLSGTWRDAHRSGDVYLKFAADGKSFQGNWTIKGRGGGSIIGKRVIASTPALRQ